MSNQNLKPGMTWMPYIPVQKTQTISEGFNPKISIKSRYAIKVVNSSFYGTLNGEYWSLKNYHRKFKIEKIFKIEKPN